MPTPVYTVTVTEERSGLATIIPSFPNDRVVSGPWLAFIAKNDVASDHSNVIKATNGFPAQTRFTSTYPSDGFTGVRAFAFMDYGNYLDGTTKVPASRVNAIKALTATWDFTLTATAGAANGCLDWFLFSSAAGTTATIVNEIQVYWETPASTKAAFLDTLPVVGIYTSAAIAGTQSISWKVTYERANAQGKHYFQFRPLAGSDGTLSLTTASFDLKAAMLWLTTQSTPGAYTTKAITGNEYFTGFGNGYEILNGKVQLDVNAISVTYSK